jgi:hypothetical protein
VASKLLYFEKAAKAASMAVSTFWSIMFLLFMQVIVITG